MAQWIELSIERYREQSQISQYKKHLLRSLKQGFQGGEIAQDECNQYRQEIAQTHTVFFLSFFQNFPFFLIEKKIKTEHKNKQTNKQKPQINQ